MRTLVLVACLAMLVVALLELEASFISAQRAVPLTNSPSLAAVAATGDAREGLAPSLAVGAAHAPSPLSRDARSALRCYRKALAADAFNVRRAALQPDHHARDETAACGS